MPIEKTIKLYQFDELDDRAKERAREWYRGEDCTNRIFTGTVEAFAEFCKTH